MNNSKKLGAFSKISKSPPGWETWIEHRIDEGMDEEIAYATAWDRYNKGMKPRKSMMEKEAKSPPGWEEWCEEQKKKGDYPDSEIFGTAWKQYNKGYKPSKKESKIVKRKDGYHVISEEGKNLGGGYKTREEAEKRLKQVEYFKHKKGAKETIQDKSEDFADENGLYYEGSAGSFQEFIEDDKKVLEPNKEINKWWKESKFAKILAIKNEIIDTFDISTDNIKKTSKRFIWKFDKHQPQWKFDKITGKMILDEEQLEKVGGYKWRPNKQQREEFKRRMQDPEERQAYENRQKQKRQYENWKDKDFIPTENQYELCKNLRRLKLTPEQEDAIMMVESAYINNEKVNHRYIHIVNQLGRDNGWDGFTFTKQSNKSPDTLRKLINYRDFILSDIERKMKLYEEDVINNESEYWEAVDLIDNELKRINEELESYNVEPKHSKYSIKKIALTEESKKQYQELSKKLNELTQQYADSGDSEISKEIDKLKQQMDDLYENKLDKSN